MWTIRRGAEAFIMPATGIEFEANGPTAAVRILRLTNSNDMLADLPPEQMGAAIADQIVRERTGEPVETVIRVAWPGPALPDIVDSWLDRYEPDVVFLRAPGFWVSYESVPVRLQRRLGPLGKWPGELGLKIGGTPRFANSRAGKAARKLMMRTIGGDTYFTPEQATAHVAAVFSVVLARESIIPAMRGPGHPIDSSATRKGLVRATGRVDEFDARLRVLCASLHIAFASARGVVHADSLLRADELHEGPEGQRLYGELEGHIIADAWLAAVGAGRA
jgi:hypothetical protein